MLRPPIEHVHATTLAPSTPWVFRGIADQQLADLLAEAGLEPKQSEQLLQGLVRRADAFYLRPQPQALVALPPDARGVLYRHLATHPENLAHVNACRYWVPPGLDWLALIEAPEGSRAAIEGLTYRDGELVILADLRLLLEATPVSRRLALQRALLSEIAVSVELAVEPGEDIEPLVRYWGVGGREQEVRDRLAALAAGPDVGRIDIRDLLPPFARERLNRYPADDTVLDVEQSRDCHWTALNFFADEPDDRYADATVVAQVLAGSFVPTQQPQLGDVVTFSSQGRTFHSAVYIADDLVFTRNGTRRIRPWMLMPLSAMRRFYARDTQIEVQFLRRDPRG